MTTKPGMRYCTYCRHNRPEESFVDVFDKVRKQRVNRKCSYCVGIAKKSKEFRDDRGKRLAEIRRNSDAVRQQAMKKERAEKQRQKDLEKTLERKADSE